MRAPLIVSKRTAVSSGSVEASDRACPIDEEDVADGTDEHGRPLVAQQPRPFAQGAREVV